jgi:phosphatidylserine/phosphatidylglycerophosphate/cardiolipin synthase-like enzyme
MTESNSGVMRQLLDALSALVRQVSPEKIESISSKFRSAPPGGADAALTGLVGSPAAAKAIGQLITAWKKTSVSSTELAAMLLAAKHVLVQNEAEQSIELVWTGPTTPFVAARRTEQALLQVINGARKTLFITSFVAYDVSTIVKALNGAVERGVSVSMLLEASHEHGGNVSIDGIGKMQSLVPCAQVYAWREKSGHFIDGSVHAKVAVADAALCFITSANLTGYAMDRNMEVGVIFSGSEIPKLLEAHLQALVDTKIIVPV